VKFEIDRGYDWLVVCILVCLVAFLACAKYVPPVVRPVIQYFSPAGIAVDAAGSDVQGVVPPQSE
jgi:hypothetical protein